MNQKKISTAQLRKQNERLMPDIKVVGFPCDVSGCGKYRMTLPLSSLSARRELQADLVHHFFRELASYTNYNSVFLQRQCTQDQMRLVNGIFRVKRGTAAPFRIIYECDDLFHEVEPENLAADQFYDDTRLQNIQILMESSDGVSFSTEYLRDYYTDLCGLEETQVIRNCLPKWLWTFPKRKGKDAPAYNEDRTVKILWSGSYSHHGKKGDTAILRYLLMKSKKKWGDRIQWVFFGTVPDFVREENVDAEVIGWKPFYQYPRTLYSIGADIGLIPIKKCEFNRGKSDLKLQEFSACGIPSVCSKIGEGPYRNAPLACENNPKEWMDRIEKLLTDGIFFLNIRKKQYERVRWMEDSLHLWRKFLDPNGDR